MIPANIVEAEVDEAAIVIELFFYKGFKFLVDYPLHCALRDSQPLRYALVRDAVQILFRNAVLKIFRHALVRL